MKKHYLDIKKLLGSLALGTAMVMGLPALNLYAAGPEDYNDYQNEDGSYSYYFMQGLKVSMPEDWYQNTMVKADETSATFYHKDSYEKYDEEGVIDGGQLFTISYCVNDDYKDIDEMTYIGFDEENNFNYYMVKPTDYPAYAADEKTKEEYDKLWESMDEVTFEWCQTPAGV